MRNILLLTLMLIFTNLKAEWVEVDSNNKRAFYADSKSPKKSGNKVKLWELEDFRTKQHIDGLPFYSVKSQLEFNCEHDELRGIAAVIHSGHMGNGTATVLDVPKNTEWYSITPGSVAEALLEIACKK